MKRILTISLALVLSVTAFAQHSDHVSVGVGAGTNGLSLEIATSVGSHLDIRTGYNMAFALLGYTIKDVAVPEHPGNASGPSVKVPMTIGLDMNDAEVLLNYYPSATGTFHITAGAYLGGQRFGRVVAKGLPADYNTVGIDVDGYLVKATGGELTAYLCAPGLGSAKFPFKPYLGIGFGRAVSQDSKVSFVFDLGAMYQGKPSIWGTGEGLTGRLQDVQVPTDSLGDASATIDQYAGYLAFWPILNFHLYVNLF